MKFLLILVILVVCLDVYVRVAPDDPARWHVDPVTAASPKAKGYKSQTWLAAQPELVLARLDAIAMKSPRTERVAGSVTEGRVTYLTRTLLWGFPDYTTIAVAPRENGTSLAVLARSRFGYSDSGVNRARVETWLKALDPLQK